MSQNLNNFSEFYRFYLCEHKNKICRRWHFFGSSLVLLGLTLIIITGQWKFFPILFVLGYGPAWIGHFFYEKNKPATFKYPFYSLMSDWVMYKDILIGKVKI
ncbi:DUF962 domain-containing protein [bacterium]|nr:DUF962 domain-containing protein [bacterium]